MKAKAALTHGSDREIIECPGGDPGEFLKLLASGVLRTGLFAIQRAAGMVSPASSPIAPTAADVMTADEVAEWLRLDRKTVYDYAGRGVIPHQRLGKRMLFSRDAIALWLGACSKGSSERGSG